MTALRARVLHLALVLLLLGGCTPATEPELQSSYVRTPLHRDLERELDGKLVTKDIRISGEDSFEGEVQVTLRVPNVNKVDERDPYRVFAALHRLGHQGPVRLTFTSTHRGGTIRLLGYGLAEAGQLSRSEGSGHEAPADCAVEVWILGIAEGVTPELIVSITEGAAPLPVFEPLSEGVEYEWDPVTGYSVAEPEEY